mmetsp:Transcript_13756/g.36654  ORF Transcript_13756/g.36654 Transcript_13756/m.36654 type:complete len:216 (+) Transcript_13756:1975-2622(+)
MKCEKLPQRFSFRVAIQEQRRDFLRSQDDMGVAHFCPKATTTRARSKQTDCIFLLFLFLCQVILFRIIHKRFVPFQAFANLKRTKPLRESQQAFAILGVVLLDFVQEGLLLRCEIIEIQRNRALGILAVRFFAALRGIFSEYVSQPFEVLNGVGRFPDAQGSSNQLVNIHESAGFQYFVNMAGSSQTCLGLRSSCKSSHRSLFVIPVMVNHGGLF